MSGFTTTPKMGLFKPNYNMDAEQWGYHLNSNSDTIDSLLGNAMSGPYLQLVGGTVNGPVTIGANKANYITITGGDIGYPATILGQGDTGDVDFSPQFNGRLHTGISRDFPAASGHDALAHWDYNMSGVSSLGKTLFAERHVVNSDTVDAHPSSGLSYFNYAAGVNDGATGGRLGIGMSFIQAGATTMASGEYYVSSAFWATASHPAGGSSFGGTAGSMFASNDSVWLKPGAMFWEAICGYEVDIGCETGSSVNYKHGITVIFWDTDRVSGAVGKDCAYAIAAQSICSGWDYGFAFNNAYGSWPMKPTSTLIGVPAGSGTVPYTAGWGIDFSNVAFSNGSLKMPGFKVNQKGGVDFGAEAVTDPLDLSRHIMLYEFGFGFSVTSGSINYVGGSHLFHVNGTRVGIFGTTGLDACQIGHDVPAAGTFMTLKTGGVTGATWTSGPSVPVAIEPIGSLYSRTTGAVGSHVYVSQGGGSWFPIPGV